MATQDNPQIIITHKRENIFHVVFFFFGNALLVVSSGIGRVGRKIVCFSLPLEEWPAIIIIKYAFNLLLTKWNKEPCRSEEVKAKLLRFVSSRWKRVEVFDKNQKLSVPITLTGKTCRLGLTNQSARRRVFEIKDDLITGSEVVENKWRRRLSRWMFS